ncbi:MAG: hypothetical protein ABRQ25_00020 [Clostridiaceae bacterium]
MKIIENDDKCNLIINGKEIDGFIFHEKKCKKCNNSWIYYEKYDTFFCAYCNEWIEKKCGDPDCDFCKDRPDTPL